MKATLPDPRHFAADAPMPLMQAVARVEQASPSDAHAALLALAQQLAAMLDRGDEDVLREMLHKPQSARGCRILYQALDLALSPRSSGSVDEGGVTLQLFAMPVLLVVGGRQAHRVSAVLPDVDAIRALFEKTGALGHCRNFGLGNTLAALESMEAIAWTRLRSIARSGGWDASMSLDLPPAEIEVSAGAETVHLRFVSGAAVAPFDAPGFSESAGDIGRWGMQLTEELSRQLSAKDLSLLAIPRAPRTILQASQEGWFAARELGFQLFLSNALRQARMRVGEPEVTVSSCSDHTVRVRLTSPFDELFDQTYGWPLMMYDDLDLVSDSIFSLLDAAKVVHVDQLAAVEAVTPARGTAH